MLWGTTMKLAKKIASTLVLGAGVFVLVCSLLKTVFVTTVSLYGVRTPPPPFFFPPKQDNIYLILLCQQDPINGAQLAGEWGTREVFVSVATTTLPMLSPLLKSWLKPLFGSALSSNRTPSGHPSGFRTIGGGHGDSRVGRSRGSTSAKHHVTGSLSVSESEERIIDNVRMQNLKIYAEPSSTHHPSKGYHGI